MKHHTRVLAAASAACAFDIPIVRTFPGASLGRLAHVSLSFGANNVACYRTIHGKRKLQHVRGLVTPKKCPRAGFPIEAQIGFADGTAVRTTTTIPCPHR